MKIKKFEEFLNWASGGCLTASLAFIVFVPTLTNVNEELQNYAMLCFISAIPFLCVSLMKYKEYQLYKIPSKSTKGKFIHSSVAGTLFLVIGLTTLLAAIKIYYMLVFLGVMFVAVIASKGDIIEEKKKS